jgi:hypothetical protein
MRRIGFCWPNTWLALIDIALNAIDLVAMEMSCLRCMVTPDKKYGTQKTQKFHRMHRKI